MTRPEICIILFNSVSSESLIDFLMTNTGQITNVSKRQSLMRTHQFNSEYTSRLLFPRHFAFSSQCISLINNSARPVPTVGLSVHLQCNECFELALLHLIDLDPRSHALHVSVWSGESSWEQSWVRKSTDDNELSLPRDCRRSPSIIKLSQLSIQTVLTCSFKIPAVVVVFALTSIIQWLNSQNALF